MLLPVLLILLELRPIVCQNFFWNGISQFIELPKLCLVPIIVDKHRQILVVLGILLVQQQEGVFPFR